MTRSLYDGDEGQGHRGVNDTDCPPELTGNNGSYSNSDGNGNESDACADFEKYREAGSADGVRHRKVYAEPDVIGDHAGG